MRVFQRLFTKQLIKQEQWINVDKLKSIKTITPPPSFFKIPYDEQYESRDFVRDIKKDNKDNKNDKKD